MNNPHEWKRRMEHERAVSDALCAINGLPAPAHPDGGVARPPNEALMRFDGRTFAGYMEKRGHSRAAFEDCKCRARQPEIRPMVEGRG